MVRYAGLQRAVAALVMAVASLPLGAQAQSADRALPPYVALIWVDIQDAPGVIRRAGPAGEWRDWITPADFDPQAFAGRQINLWVRVRVSADDRVTGCVSRDRRTNSIWLPRACALLTQRGRFRHALSADGTPVAGDVDMTVQLTRQLPPPRSSGPRPPVPGVLPPPGSGGVFERAVPRDSRAALRGIPQGLPNRDVVLELDVSVEGVVTRCVMRESTGTDAGDMAVCSAVTALPFIPAKGEKGDPMPQRGRVMHLSLGPAGAP